MTVDVVKCGWPDSRYFFSPIFYYWKFGYVLKVELTGYADGLNKRCEER